MFTTLFGHLHELDEEYPTEFNYFGQIGETLFTLFQIMTLDNWAPMCREVMLTYSWAWFPFVTFVIISGFIVVNLIIAVLCDAISSLHKDDQAKLERGYGSADEATPIPMDIREQLDCLEQQMEELTRIQARTFHTLQFLTRKMQMHKLKKELTQKNMFADAVQNQRWAQKDTSQKQGHLSFETQPAKSDSFCSDEFSEDDDDANEAT